MSLAPCTGSWASRACTGKAITWVNRHYGFAGEECWVDWRRCVPVFRHGRPALDYLHWTDNMRYPGYSYTSGEGAMRDLSTRQGGKSVTQGPSLGLDPADPWPKEWAGVFFADFEWGWAAPLLYPPSCEPHTRSIYLKCSTTAI